MYLCIDRKDIFISYIGIVVYIWLEFTVQQVKHGYC